MSKAKTSVKDKEFFSLPPFIFQTHLPKPLPIDLPSYPLQPTAGSIRFLGRLSALRQSIAEPLDLPTPDIKAAISAINKYIPTLLTAISLLKNRTITLTQPLLPAWSLPFLTGPSFCPSEKFPAAELTAVLFAKALLTRSLAASSLASSESEAAASSLSSAASVFIDAAESAESASHCNIPAALPRLLSELCLMEAQALYARERLSGREKAELAMGAAKRAENVLAGLSTLPDGLPDVPVLRAYAECQKLLYSAAAKFCMAEESAAVMSYGVCVAWADNAKRDVDAFLAVGKGKVARKSLKRFVEKMTSAVEKINDDTKMWMKDNRILYHEDVPDEVPVIGGKMKAKPEEQKKITAEKLQGKEADVCIIM